MRRGGSSVIRVSHYVVAKLPYRFYYVPTLESEDLRLMWTLVVGKIPAQGSSVLRN